MQKRQRITLLIDDESTDALDALTKALGKRWSSIAFDAVHLSLAGAARARLITPRDDGELAAVTAALTMYEEELRNESDPEDLKRVAAVGRVLDRLGIQR